MLFHISFFQTKPYLYKATRPTSVGENACAKGNISTFARECPGASYWSSFTIEIGSLEEMAGSFPLGNPPFSPCFSTLFQTEMEDFTKTHQEALGLQFLQLASGKLTDSYGKGPVKTWTSTQTRTQAVIPYSCWQNLEQHPFCCHHISILTLIFLVKMVIFVLVWYVLVKWWFLCHGDGIIPDPPGKWSVSHQPPLFSTCPKLAVLMDHLGIP